MRRAAKPALPNEGGVAVALRGSLPQKSRTVQIRVNGQPREIAEGTTIAQLLDQLELTTKYVAVEVNLQLVPRGQHAGHRLAEGDRLEIVTLVGGG